MANLFELSCELTMDTAAFLRSVRQAEQTARELHTLLDKSSRQTSASMLQLQQTATGVWSSITAGIQAAINKTHEFLNISGGPKVSTAGIQGLVSGAVAKPLATGMPYVPYDNYSAVLHRGEAVLTSLEAARWREGAAATATAMDFSGLGSLMAEALSQVHVELDGETVGRMVAGSSARAMGETAQMRRYSP